MNSYIPQVGHKVLVDYEDIGLQVETINGVSNDGRFIALFQDDPGEQCAARNPEGLWHLEESGQRVFLLDPYARPERSGLGFVLPTDGPVERWYMDAEHAHGVVEGFLHAEQVSGIAHIQADGTWEMNERDQIFFISEKQARKLTGALVDDEIETAAILADPNAMEAITEGEVEFNEKAAKGPQVGDFTSRVVKEASLLYRVRSVEYGTYAALDLVLGPDGCNLTENVCLTATGWEWPDGKKVTFTSGSGTWQALAATRLTTLRETLRNKYFHYTKMAVESEKGAGLTLPASYLHGMANESVEMLFLAETGLLPEQDSDRYDEFCETLHDEFLASKES